MIKLTLDSNALTHFIAGQGEEFKLSLRTAILGNAIKKHMSLPMPAEFQKMCDKAAKEATEGYLVEKSRYGNPVYSELNPKIKDTIKKSFTKFAWGKIEKDYKRVMRDIIEKEYKEAAEIMQISLEDRISQVKKQVDIAINAHVNQGVATYISATVKAQIENLMVKVGNEKT